MLFAKEIERLDRLFRQTNDSSRWKLAHGFIGASLGAERRG
jgi:hypothetical protein